MKKPDMTKYATKKQLEKHAKEMHKAIEKATKQIKKWDVKQDKALLKKKAKNQE